MTALGGMAAMGATLAFSLQFLAVGAVAPMNRGDYKIANPVDPDGHDAKMHFRGEFFEVLGPLDEGHYGEVHWRPEETPLPPEIVKRFDGKVMAVTGYEVDIVRPGPDGTLTSVPCTQHYNHHYSAFMSGKAASQLEEHELRERFISDLVARTGTFPWIAMARHCHSGRSLRRKAK